MSASEEWTKRLDSVYATRFFRRRPSPTREMSDVLLETRLAGKLDCFFLWGVHEKPGMDSDDQETMERLQALLAHMAERLECHVSLAVVVCDTHGLVNDVTPSKSSAYAAAVEQAVKERGWEVRRMSTIWASAGVSMQMIDAAGYGSGLTPLPPRLVRFAQRHFRGQPRSPEIGARRYLTARLLERPVLTRLFRGRVHLTPSEPSLDPLQPATPIFHIWTRKRGCSAKPWFSGTDV